MDPETIKLISSLVDKTGPLATILLGVGFLVWKLAPGFIARDERKTAAWEKLSENVGSITVRQDTIYSDLSDMREEFRDEFKDLKDLLKKP